MMSILKEKSLLNGYRAFVDVPIPRALLEEMCQYVILQHPSAELFLKYLKSTMLPDTLHFLDIAINEFEDLSLDNFSLKVVIQALNKYLQTQPLLGDFPILGTDLDDSKQQHVESIFYAIMKLESENIFKLHILLTLFENLIVCSDNSPPFTKLAYVLCYLGRKC